MLGVGERKNVPSVSRIADHYVMAHDECWGCWEHRPLERCHIIPHSIGGADSDPANYVLLCNRCHEDSPDVRDADEMWRWIADRKKWTNVLLDALRPNVAALVKMRVSDDQFNATVRRVLKEDTSTHKATTRPTTLAWAIRRAGDLLIAGGDSTE